MSQEPTKNSSQEIKNKSFDPTFQTSQVELLGFDSDNNVLRPIATDANGQVKIDPTALDARYHGLNDPIEAPLEAYFAKTSYTGYTLCGIKFSGTGGGQYQFTNQAGAAVAYISILGDIYGNSLYSGGDITANSALNAGSNSELFESDITVLRYGSDNEGYFSGMPFEMRWSYLDNALIFDDGNGNVQNVMCNPVGVGSGLTGVNAATLGTYAIGTSGDTIPLLSGANTWSNTNKFSTGITLQNDDTITNATNGVIKFLSSGSTYNDYLTMDLQYQWAVKLAAKAASDDSALQIQLDSSLLINDNVAISLGGQSSSTFMFSQASSNGTTRLNVSTCKIAQNLGYFWLRSSQDQNSAPTTSVLDPHLRISPFHLGYDTPNYYLDLWSTEDYGRIELGNAIRGTKILMGADLDVLGKCGTEKILNGHFDVVSGAVSTTGWTLNSGWATAIVSTYNGYLVKTAGNTNTAVYGSNAPTAGHKYIVTYQLKAVTAGTVVVSYGGVNLATGSAVGEYTEIITATSTANLTITPSSTFAGQIDNISVKEIGLGNLRVYGNLGVGNSAAATTLGSVAKKMEIFDSAGTSLGFVPIYDAIT